MTDPNSTGGIPAGNPAQPPQPTGGAGSSPGSAGAEPAPAPPCPPPFPPPGVSVPPVVVPTDADHALEIGRMHFPEVGSPGGPASLMVHEFDIGYLVYAGYPPREDPTALPPAPGGSNIVISKADGEVTFLPNFPPEPAVELYRRLQERPNTP